ncbi:MAG: hypothetical protein K5756_10105 [Clostridiales bacterium]|nr:hypothetical protein [Clostridiales bacterium]
MDNFCEKCQSPLNEDGRCPYCDAGKKTSANKKKAFPVILVIVILLVVGGIIFAVHKSMDDRSAVNGNKSSEPAVSENAGGQDSQTTEDQNKTSEDFSPEKVYAQKIKLYSDIYNDYLNQDESADPQDPDEYENIISALIRDFYFYDEDHDKIMLAYCFYDISNDGMPELIIAHLDYDEDGKLYPRTILDMFGYENGEIKRLIPVDELIFGYDPSVTFYPEGVILIETSKTSTEESVFYSLAKGSATAAYTKGLCVEYRTSDNEPDYFVESEDQSTEISKNEYMDIRSKYTDGNDLSSQEWIYFKGSNS